MNAQVDRVPRVAIVHDWLVTYAGAERVLEQLLAIYPQADLFSLVDFVPHAQRAFLGGRQVRTSALQRWPFARTRYRLYLPLMPVLIEQFDMSQYDIVISSSHAIAKGVLTGPDTLHICLCYSPIRYAWDLQFQYLRETGRSTGFSGAIAKALLHYIRLWDTRTSAGVDQFIAISHFIARRIRKAYRRESTVIYPPVDVQSFVPGAMREDFYVTASRLVPYKRVDLMLDAFRAMPTRRLVVIGDGPDMAKLRERLPSNVTLLGAQPFAVLRDHLQRARAFVFAAEEDFGIAPIEAQACGTPVVAFGRGAARETIRGLEDERPSGLFFESQTVEALVAAIDTFERESARITESACRTNAERFATKRFSAQVQSFVDEAWRAWAAASHTPGEQTRRPTDAAPEARAACSAPPHP